MQLRSATPTGFHSFGRQRTRYNRRKIRARPPQTWVVCLGTEPSAPKKCSISQSQRHIVLAIRTEELTPSPSVRMQYDSSPAIFGIGWSSSFDKTKKACDRPPMTQLTMKAKKLTKTKGNSFFHLGHRRGSRGSPDGCGMRTISVLPAC